MNNGVTPFATVNWNVVYHRKDGTSYEQEKSGEAFPLIFSTEIAVKRSPYIERAFVSLKDGVSEPLEIGEDFTDEDRVRWEAEQTYLDANGKPIPHWYEFIGYALVDTVNHIGCPYSDEKARITIFPSEKEAKSFGNYKAKKVKVLIVEEDK